MLMKCCGCAGIFPIKMRMWISNASSTTGCCQVLHLLWFYTFQLKYLVSYVLCILCLCFYVIFCISIGVWLLFWSAIFSAISISTTFCPLLMTSHSAEQRTILQSGVCQWYKAWSKQTALVTISDLIYAGDWTGRVQVCMCFTKCEVGHSRLVGSAAKDKCNLKWDLYSCIQVAFCHPVTKVSGVTCPFLQCWCCKWSCSRLCIKPHYRYSLTILSSVAEEWGALSLYLVNAYVLQKIFLSYLYPHVFHSSCIIHRWRICISLKLKVPRAHCNDERNGGRRSWLGLVFFWPSTFADSFIVQKSLNEEAAELVPVEYFRL